MFSGKKDFRTIAALTVLAIAAQFAVVTAMPNVAAAAGKFNQQTGKPKWPRGVWKDCKFIWYKVPVYKRVYSRKLGIWVTVFDRWERKVKSVCRIRPQ